MKLETEREYKRRRPGWRRLPKRERLNAAAAEMRDKYLNQGTGCKSTARAIELMARKNPQRTHEF